MNTPNQPFAPCPTCGNDDVEQIVWDDPDGGADLVACLECGTRYDPTTGELQVPS